MKKVLWALISLFFIGFLSHIETHDADHSHEEKLINRTQSHSPRIVTLEDAQITPHLPTAFITSQAGSIINIPAALTLKPSNLPHSSRSPPV